MSISRISGVKSTLFDPVMSSFWMLDYIIRSDYMCIKMETKSLLQKSRNKNTRKIFYSSH